LVHEEEDDDGDSEGDDGDEAEKGIGAVETLRRKEWIHCKRVLRNSGLFSNKNETTDRVNNCGETEIKK